MPVTPDYEKFHNHPFIQTIKDIKKWTISTADKTPIDFYQLIYKGSIEGAQFHDEVSLTDLDTLHKYIPNAANYAFFLDARIDNFVILDIEPKCPDNIKKQLMQMDYIYAETSMSGKGIHLIFPLPDVLFDYPNAETKPVFREQHGYYEILLSHFVTFTGNLLPDNPSPSKNFTELFESMAKEQKVSHRTDVEIEEMDVMPDHPCAEEIMEKMMMYAPKYEKTLHDFDDNHNAYEFGVIAYAYKILKRILHSPHVLKQGELDSTEKAYYLYNIAKEVIPERPKHHEYRDGLPWLWYLAREVMAKTDAPDDSQEK